VSDSPPPPPQKGVTRASVAKAVTSTVERRVRWACVLSLVALALIVWSLVSRAPLAVIAAMSIGQVIGTLSLLFFLGSIALDVRSRYKVESKHIMPDSLRHPPRSSDEQGSE
jgi:preprotein translocase subunit SecF